MWSSMPNLSTVGLTVWPPIENRHTDTQTHSHLYYIDLTSHAQGLLSRGCAVKIIHLSAECQGPDVNAVLCSLIVVRLSCRPVGVRSYLTSWLPPERALHRQVSESDPVPLSSCRVFLVDELNGCIVLSLVVEFGEFSSQASAVLLMTDLHQGF